MRASRADVAVAVTGIAGPGGGTPESRSGMVCFAWAARGGPARPTTHHLAGDRAAVREASVAVALEGLLELATG